MNRKQIPVLKGTTLRSGVATVVGVMTAETLVERFEVPERHSLKKTGYQRQASQPRVNKLASTLSKKKVDLPTAVLISLRNVKPDDVLIEGEHGSFILDLDYGDEGIPLYVVDGQHRIKALEKAMADSANMQNFKVPFVCMIGADENQEMEQFYVVNSNAKSVSTDLAYALIRDRAMADPEIMRDLIDQGMQWQVDAQQITEMLAKSSPIWRNRIRLVNSLRGETTIPAASMVKSLQPIIRHTPTFSAIKDLQQQMQIIDAYWNGVRKVMEDAFADPFNFSVQKGIGVRTLHGIFPIVLEHVRSKGGSIFRPEDYKDILESPLKEISGNNGYGDSVSGLDFWRSGKGGAIGTYSGVAGINALIEQLKVLLPAIVIE